jgi:hypothetical protein
VRQRARRDGSPGKYGNVGIVESVGYRILWVVLGSESHPLRQFKSLRIPAATARKPLIVWVFRAELRVLECNTP